MTKPDRQRTKKRFNRPQSAAERQCVLDQTFQTQIIKIFIHYDC
jgi:hypothetical protein